MTQQSYEHDDDENDDQQQRQPNWRRDLEARAKKGDEATAKLAEQDAANRAMQQELAMRRAGIDPTHPVAALLAKANPDLVDVDSIKTEWEKLQPPGPQVPVEEQAAMARISAAQAGGASGGGAVPDFEAELDAIPLVKDGQYNPDYASEVLRLTQVQAAREGRHYVVSAGAVKAQAGHRLAPATTPLSQ